ncbi:P-loop ATPase, Sll1717 family [Salinisphaera orenii]|uniref:P-loop ATPase, Sll1717 family n=1 Tax=Salinisphaera orenii TaxID=856731 RepID=UPI000F46811F|nr:DNA repair protein [Salinisphaera halophila]
MARKQEQFAIRKNLKAGELDAEADEQLMQACFYDKGDIDLLADVEDPKAVIAGRTGSGKTALLLRLQRQAEHASMLDPHDVSVRFLENSNIIQFLNELGIKLDLFYRVLWRHVLTVELVKLRYELKSESDSRGFWNSIKAWAGKDQAKKKALDYFSEWGDRFWINTDEHLKELTKKFSKDVQANLKANGEALDLSANGARRLSEETRTELKQRASEAVNKIQIQKLDQVVQLLGDYAFRDRQKRYYILIDKLDEDWADTQTRLQFIRALIEEIKYFRNIGQIKIIIALRVDLLQIIFDKTRGSGFQQEKYESLICSLRWGEGEIKALIEKRLNKIFEDQYTGRSLSFSDIFPSPKKGGGQKPEDYIIERTLFRPRDALQYVNECFELAADRGGISWRVIRGAEAVYSRKRMNSLKEEWEEIYPNLIDTLEVLRGLKSSFTRSDLNEDRIESVAEVVCGSGSSDPCVACMDRFYSPDSKIKQFDLVYELIACFYRIGAIGIKVSSLDTFSWSHIDQPYIGKSEVKRSNQLKIHKMLHRELEIKDS